MAPASASPMGASSTQTIMNLVFGLAATVLSIIAVWQGYKMWKARSIHLASSREVYHDSSCTLPSWPIKPYLWLLETYYSSIKAFTPNTAAPRWHRWCRKTYHAILRVPVLVVISLHKPNLFNFPQAHILCRQKRSWMSVGRLLTASRPTSLVMAQFRQRSTRA